MSRLALRTRDFLVRLAASAEQRMLQTAGDPRSGHWCVTVFMKKSEMDHGIRCNVETGAVCKDDVKDDGNGDTGRIHSPRRGPLAIFDRARYERH